MQDGGIVKNIQSTIPLFLWHKRRKEKAWQKESAVLWGSAQTRKFFEKNLTKNFPLKCGANTPRSTVERTHYDKKIKPQFQSF